MSITLRIILIICSIFAFLLLITKIKQAKLKVTNSVIWMIGAITLIIMSIFSNMVEWISTKLGFIAPVNFVFLIVMIFLLIEVFLDNIRISQLSEKIKELNHYIALSEHEQKNEKQKQSHKE